MALPAFADDEDGEDPEDLLLFGLKAEGDASLVNKSLRGLLGAIK